MDFTMQDNWESELFRNSHNNSYVAHVFGSGSGSDLEMRFDLMDLDQDSTAAGNDRSNGISLAGVEQNALKFTPSDGVWAVAKPLGHGLGIDSSNTIRTYQPSLQSSTPQLPAGFGRGKKSLTKSRVAKRDNSKCLGTPSSRTFHCDVCPASFSENRSLLRHQRTIHGIHNNPTLEMVYECSICETSFNRKENRDRHIKEKHEAAKVECMACGKSVIERYLGEHQDSAPCQAMRAISEAKAERQMTCISNDSTIYSAGRFGAESVASVWLISNALYNYTLFEFKGDGFRSASKIVKFFELRGCTLRILNRLLTNCPRAARIEVAGALYCLYLVNYEFAYTFQETSYLGTNIVEDLLSATLSAWLKDIEEQTLVFSYPPWIFLRFITSRHIEVDEKEIEYDRVVTHCINLRCPELSTASTCEGQDLSNRPPRERFEILSEYTYSSR